MQPAERARNCRETSLNVGFHDSYAHVDEVVGLAVAEGDPQQFGSLLAVVSPVVRDIAIEVK